MKETEYQSEETPWKMECLRQFLTAWVRAVNRIRVKYGDESPLLLIDAMAGCGRNNTGRSTTTEMHRIINCADAGLAGSPDVLFLAIEQDQECYRMLRENLRREQMLNDVDPVLGRFEKLIADYDYLQSMTPFGFGDPSKVHGVLVIDHQGFPNRKQHKAIRKFAGMFPRVDVFMHYDCQTLRRNFGQNALDIPGFGFYKRRYKKAKAKHVGRRMAGYYQKQFCLCNTEMFQNRKYPRVKAVFTNFCFHGLEDVFSKQWRAK